MTVENVKTELQKVLDRLAKNNLAFEILNDKIWNERITGETKDEPENPSFLGYLQEIENLLAHISNYLDVYESEVNRLESKVHDVSEYVTTPTISTLQDLLNKREY